MTGIWTFDTLRTTVEDGAIDTVLACFVDMQGRLMGKRFTGRHFVDSAWKETHCCNYLLATDLEMATPDGYAAASWQDGYGDYVMRADLGSIRPLPWLEGTALVMCDILDHHGEAPVPHAPISVLKTQIARLDKLGYQVMAATELEFFLFTQSLEDLRDNGFSGLTPISAYNEDYHILQTTKEEPILRPIRNHLLAAGIPVENTKGEAEAGQAELNIRYADALSTAEYHSIAKHAVKEIAWQNGASASFLAKWRADRVGSSSHIHLSLWKDGEPAFFDPAGDQAMSAVMRAFCAGLLAFAPEYTCFLAPYINSYKRFRRGSFAPTHSTWSVDNRTAGFRLCGGGSKAVRMECRIGGADLNPYLALAGLIAAGIAGIEQGLDLPPAAEGDQYRTDGAKIPASLAEATHALEQSSMLRAAMGDAVVEHYARAARWEQEEFERAVTDWEIARGFERA